MNAMLKLVVVAAAVVSAFANPAYADEQAPVQVETVQTSPAPLSPLDLMQGKRYVGFYSEGRNAMGVDLVVKQVNGKEGNGRITFYPHDRRVLSCWGEHDAALLLQDNGKVKVSFYRPICDDEAGVKKGNFYTLEVKEGGNEVVTNGGGTLKAKN